MFVKENHILVGEWDSVTKVDVVALDFAKMSLH